MPADTPIGIIVCLAATVLGFSLVWYIWWLAIISFAVIPIVFIVRSFNLNTEKIIPAAEVEKEHKAWLDEVAQAKPVTRTDETHSANRGLAVVEVTA